MTNSKKPQDTHKLPSKPWYTSKTVLFNAAIAAIGIATSATPYIEPYVSTEAFGLVTAGIGFANAILRFVTSKSLNKGGYRD